MDVGMDIGDATTSRGLAAYSRALTRDAGDALGLLAARRTRSAFSLGPLTVSYETETAPTAEDAAVQAAESLQRMRAFNFADSLQTQQMLVELAPAALADGLGSTPPDSTAGAQAALTGQSSPIRTPAAGARAYARCASPAGRAPLLQVVA